MARRKNASKVVRAQHKRIAYVFDFDETLAPNTTNAMLHHLGVDPETFRADEVEPLESDGWETRLAEAHAMAKLSRTDAGPITAQSFEAVAAELELYPGADSIWDRLRDDVAAIDSEIDVEFHLVTAGFVNVPAATSIADEFTSIIGGHWAYDDDGQILTPKSTVGHYDKVRHLLAIAKGIDTTESTTDHDVYRHVDEADMHVPFEQMIFVGDGDSDLPGFDLMQSTEGTAIAVYQADSAQDWESRTNMRDGRQVAALVPSDFSKGSPLESALLAAGRRAASRIQLLAASNTEPPGDETDT